MFAPNPFGGKGRVDKRVRADATHSNEEKVIQRVVTTLLSPLTEKGSEPCLSECHPLRLTRGLSLLFFMGRGVEPPSAYSSDRGERPLASFVIKHLRL